MRLTPLWILGGIGLIAIIIYLSLTPGGPPVPVAISDKLQHLLAYTVLIVWFGGIFKRRALWLVLLGLLVMGVGLEFLQKMSGHRTFDEYDMIMNGLGLALGKKLCRLGLGGWCRHIERWLPFVSSPK